MSAPRTAPAAPAASAPNTTQAVLAEHELVIDSARRGALALLRPEVVEHALLALHRELSRLAALGEAPPARDAPATRDAVLISVEARSRGYKRTDSFRRWCQRRGVPLCLVGRRTWVRPADVDGVLARIAAGPGERVVVGMPGTLPEPVADAAQEVISRIAKPRPKPRKAGR